MKNQYYLLCYCYISMSQYNNISYYNISSLQFQCFHTKE